MSSGRRLRPSPWTAALLLTAVLTCARLFAVFLTPLELYPDEAQYWLWSRELAWGYYSKPPMVAWWIAGTTALGGDGEPWIRLGSVLAHAGAALALFAAGRRLYDGWTGFWAAALYSLMPGVQLSAGLMTTDAPMLLFLSLALWAYAAWLTAPTGRGVVAAGALGSALGLAMLSKYAAVYFAAGLVLHALLDRDVRRRWRPSHLAAVLLGALAVTAPNLLWNARHGFATVAHTADNAQWSGRLFNPGELLQFLTAQLGVFGPLPFLALLGLLAFLAVSRSARASLTLGGRGLLWLTVIPLAVVAGQAFISRANANWAVAAYAPGSVLLAAWLVQRARAAWSRLLLGATVISQAAAAALFIAVVLSPAAASALGLDNAFKRARGWRATSEAIVAQARAGTWTAVTTDDRFLFNALAYYGRSFWSRPEAPPLRMWVREASPQNQAETEAPLRPSEAGRVLHASLTPEYAPETARDFQVWRPLTIVRAPLDRKRVRETTLHIASGWARAPRDPATGRPYARPTAP